MSGQKRWSVGCTHLDPGQHDVTHVYEAGQRDALAAAVQRVEALLDQGDCPDCSFTSRDQQIVAAIKGDSDE